MASREEMATCLLEMGFSDIEVDCALQATEFKGTEPAVEWLLEQSGNAESDVFSLNQLSRLLPGGGWRVEATSEEDNLQNLERGRLDGAVLGQSNCEVDLEEDEEAKSSADESEDGDDSHYDDDALEEEESTEDEDVVCYEVEPLRKRCSEAIVEVQLPSGDLVVQTFGVNEPLSAVRLYLQMNHLKESTGDVVLSTINPKKAFKEEEEYDCPLKDLLGLASSYVLLLKAEVVEFSVKISRVEPKRVLDEGFLSMQFRLAESQFARMATHQRQKISSVDVVQNARLRSGFKAKQRELEEKGKGESLLLFHGTPQPNIEAILKNNFDLSIVANGRRYGNGVYFSERPEVSLGYSRDQKSLILCEVLLGENSTEVGNGDGGDGRAWAVVVPDVQQILPRFVINFK